ncbi:MAG: DUF1249 domain-containing protein, partial [Gammaproteobacteria bacterium]|nr:DUF1249 domain-containing protein [Gammaproteobacteria bacterium]
DSYLVPECTIKPQSFGGLMTLYEANYIKLEQILAKQRFEPGEYVSSVADDCPLYLSVLDLTRFTCSFRLTYRFQQNSETVADPDLLGRIYYDARMVEVKGWSVHHRHEAIVSIASTLQGKGNNIERRWVYNMMLSKWLDYIQGKGHCFSSGAE